jgi:hypothetical protein
MKILIQTTDELLRVLKGSPKGRRLFIYDNKTGEDLSDRVYLLWDDASDEEDAPMLTFCSYESKEGQPR